MLDPMPEVRRIEVRGRAGDDGIGDGDGNGNGNGNGNGQAAAGGGRPATGW